MSLEGPNQHVFHCHVVYLATTKLLSGIDHSILDCLIHDNESFSPLYVMIRHDNEACEEISGIVLN